MTASPNGQDEAVRHRSISPLWPEIAAAVAGFVLSYALVAVALAHERDPAVQALVGLVAAAAIGMVAAMVAASVRIRELAPLGIGHTRVKHVLTGAVLGIVIYLIGAAAGAGAVAAAGDLNDLGADLEAVATGGWVSLSLTVVTGAVIAPLGGEPTLVTDDHTNSIMLRRPAWILLAAALSFLAAANRFDPVIAIAFVLGVITALLVRWSVAMTARWPHIVRVSEMGYTLGTPTRVD